MSDDDLDAAVDKAVASARREFFNSDLTISREQRDGQAFVNLASQRFPEIAERLRQTSADPFYVDDRLPSYLRALAIEIAISRIKVVLLAEDQDWVAETAAYPGLTWIDVDRESAHDGLVRMLREQF